MTLGAQIKTATAFYIKTHIIPRVLTLKAVGGKFGAIRPQRIIRSIIDALRYLFCRDKYEAADDELHNLWSKGWKEDG